MSLPNSPNISRCPEVRRHNSLTHEASMKDIEAFCRPESIVIIGASGREGKIGNTIVRNVVDWPGRLYLVNPRETEILGKKVHQNLSDIPDDVALAIIAVDAKKAVEAAKLCAVSERTLWAWSHDGTAPAALRIGKGTVRYSRRAYEQWVAAGCPRNGGHADE